MTKENVTIKLYSTGYRIEWENGDIGFLGLYWGLRKNGSEEIGRKQDGFSFFFKWRLELEGADSEETEYTETVVLDVDSYSCKDDFQVPLVDALKKIFVRASKGDVNFVVFLIKHFEVFFNRLCIKIDDVKFNIALITDIFEQALVLSQSDLKNTKGVSFTYPEKRGGDK